MASFGTSAYKRRSATACRAIVSSHWTQEKTINRAPRWLWYGTLAGLGAAITAVMGGALLLRQGAAGLPAAGPLQLDGAAGPITLEAGAHTMQDARALPAVSALTAELTAALEAGPFDAAYGLWLWHCDGARQHVFALDAAGYAAWFAPDERPPWGWFLHARPAPASNRLRVHLDGERLALYEAAAGVGPVCAMGVYAAAGRDGGASVRIERLRAWYEAPG